MRSSPCFSFYADDFIGGTITMTNEERGLYILLLCLQWTQGSVSADDFSRLGSAMALPSLDRIKKKFHPSPGGMLQNRRLEDERSKQAQYREDKRVAGIKGAERRWQSHGTPIVLPMAEGMAKDGFPVPVPVPVPSSLPVTTNTGDASRPGGVSVLGIVNGMKKPSMSKASSIDEVKLFCAEAGISDQDATWFWQKMEGNGWKNGGKQMKNWHMVLTSWRTAGYLPSQKQNGNVNGGKNAPTSDPAIFLKHWTKDKAPRREQFDTDSIFDTYFEGWKKHFKIA